MFERSLYNMYRLLKLRLKKLSFHFCTNTYLYVRQSSGIHLSLTLTCIVIRVYYMRYKRASLTYYNYCVHNAQVIFILFKEQKEEEEEKHVVYRSMCNLIESSTI